MGRTQTTKIRGEKRKLGEGSTKAVEPRSTGR
uniref:Uncharacterized protein n=1 Tax=Arundo donax TaxID=35708 RepID=A0A0A9CJI7_ARUDO